MREYVCDKWRLYVKLRSAKWRGRRRRGEEEGPPVLPPAPPYRNKSIRSTDTAYPTQAFLTPGNFRMWHVLLSSWLRFPLETINPKNKSGRPSVMISGFEYNNVRFVVLSTEASTYVAVGVGAGHHSG